MSIGVAMDQYRKTFWLYLVVWLALVLTPAIYVLLSQSDAQRELRQMYSDANRNVVAPLLERYGLQQYHTPGSAEVNDTMQESDLQIPVDVSE